MMFPVTRWRKVGIIVVIICILETGHAPVGGTHGGGRAELGRDRGHKRRLGLLNHHHLLTWR